MPETELKFLIDPAQLHRVAELPALAGGIKTARVETSETTYFDTILQDLWKRGFSFRIRSASGRLVQTLKQEQESVLTRGEWEAVIAPPQKGDPLVPELAAIEATPLAAILDDRVRASLRPVFGIGVERTVFAVTEGAATIEVSIDHGEIHSKDGCKRTAQISEVELELKRGDARAVFSLARRIAADAPLSLSLISKAQRGHLLVKGASGAPAKASAPRLAEDAALRPAFKAICRTCLHDFMLNAAALQGSDEIEAVHQGRIALRRLRAALTLIKPLAAAADHARFNGELKWLAGVFGAARDRDVLNPDGPGAPIFHGANDFIAWREEKRIAAHAAVRGAVASARWRLFLVDFAEWIEFGAWRMPPARNGRGHAAGFVRARLRRRLRALLKSARDLESLDPHEQHQVRIKAKKLRYMAQFFAPLPEVADAKRMRTLLDCLDKIQSSLGALRDDRARRSAAEAEIGQWRRENGDRDAAALADAEHLALLDFTAGKGLAKAVKACARLAAINPF